MKLAIILLTYIVLVVINISFVDSDQSYLSTNAVPQVHDTEKKEALAGGHEKKGEHYSELHQEKHSGKSSKHDEEKARKGEKLKENHKKTDKEKGGKKTKHHSKDHHSSHHEETGHGGDDFSYKHGGHHKKLNYKKGFRDVYHKDERKKHNSFYSNGQKSGEFEIYGAKHANHKADYHSKKSGGTHKSSKGADKHGKSSKKAGGHNKKDEKGHKSEKSFKKHHENQRKYASKSQKKGGKKHAVKAK